MSESLSEQIADFIFDELEKESGALEIADQILDLFPPQLTEDEIYNIILETEANSDTRDWASEAHSTAMEIEKARENNFKRIREVASALIGKCATPTFSGGEAGLHITCDFCHTELTEPGALLFGIPNEKKIMYVSKRHVCKYCYSKLTVPGNTEPKKKPTEQKEYKLPKDELNKLVEEGIKHICSKPIPAEKKEWEPKCVHEYKDKLFIANGIDKKFNLNPTEPKPKDRIEELEVNDV